MAPRGPGTDWVSTVTVTSCLAPSSHPRLGGLPKAPVIPPHSARRQGPCPWAWATWYWLSAFWRKPAIESGDGLRGSTQRWPCRGGEARSVSLLTCLFPPTRVSYCKTDKVLGHSVCRLGAQKLWQLPVAVTVPPTDSPTQHLGVPYTSKGG